MEGRIRRWEQVNEDWTAFCTILSVEKPLKREDILKNNKENASGTAPCLCRPERQLSMDDSTEIDFFIHKDLHAASRIGEWSAWHQSMTSSMQEFSHRRQGRTRSEYSNSSATCAHRTSIQLRTEADQRERAKLVEPEVAVIYWLTCINGSEPDRSLPTTVAGRSYIPSRLSLNWSSSPTAQAFLALAPFWKTCHSIILEYCRAVVLFLRVSNWWRALRTPCPGNSVYLM